MNASIDKSVDPLLFAPSTSRRKWLRASLSHRSMVTGAIVIILLILIAVFAPVVTPHSPASTDSSRILFSPDSHNLLGTDQYGRDMLSRIAFGARISMLVGLSVMLFAGVVGTLVGLISGYIRWLDNILMRIVDIIMAFPSFMLALGIVAVIGQSLRNVIIALGIMSIPGVSRVVRGVTLQLREFQYVEAARATGASSFRILGRHILPNCVGPLTVQLTVVFATAVLAEASLSFIGAGVPPHVPSWGIILSHGRDYLVTGPWIALFAGTAITITVLGINLFGDGLRDVTDPHLRNR
jgi:peptide/nickel transport system permease protein